jgi:hypothetical protein
VNTQTAQPNDDATPKLTTADITETLRECAMLASIHVKLWTGETSDPKIIAKIKADAGASGNIGRVIKNLLAGADDDLKAVKAAYAALRARHYMLTLPFVAEVDPDRARGPRLLPTVLFTRYLEEISALKRACDAKRDTFLETYPISAEIARANLAGLVSEDYPEPAILREQFHCEFDFLPIPSSASYHGIPPVILARLAANMERRQNLAMAGAIETAMETVRARLIHLRDRLLKPDGTLHATSLGHVVELAGLVPAWNMTGDPLLSAVAYELREFAKGPFAHTEKLRVDKSLRAGAAKQVQRILDLTNTPKEAAA